MINKTYSFINVLNTLVKDFGGIEIFSEENNFRLNKALLQVKESSRVQRDWLLFANVEKIPQRLYNAIEYDSKKQKKEFIACFLLLREAGVPYEICFNLMYDFSSVLKLSLKKLTMPKIQPGTIKFSIGYMENTTYRCCKIGNQWWMAENLNEAYGKKESDSYSKSNYIGAFSDITASRLYNWNEAIANAPEGWRLPTQDDFSNMLNYIYENYNVNRSCALRSLDRWPQGDGLDLFGFDAFPVLYDEEDGQYHLDLWTSTLSGDENYPYVYVSLGEEDIRTKNAAEDALCAIRYVTDVE